MIFSLTNTHQYRDIPFSSGELGINKLQPLQNASSKYSKQTIESLIEKVPLRNAGTNPRGEDSTNSGYFVRFSSMERAIFVFEVSSRKKMSVKR